MVWIWVFQQRGSWLWHSFLSSQKERWQTLLVCHGPDLASNWTAVLSFKVHSRLKNHTSASRRGYSIVLLIMPSTSKSSLYLLGTLLTPSRPRELLRSHSSKEEVNCCVSQRLLLTSEIWLFGIYTAFSIRRPDIYLGKLGDVSKREAE